MSLLIKLASEGSLFLMSAHMNVVLTNELQWLPNGSEFLKETGGSTSNSNSNSKPKTYTSFSCSQDSLPEFADNPITPTYLDILIAKLSPGQVLLWFSTLLLTSLAMRDEPNTCLS